MAKIKFIILIIICRPLLTSAQANPTKYSRYLVCSEHKKDWKQGYIISNTRTAIADTTVCYINGKIKNDKDENVPFASITIVNKDSDKAYSCSTALDGTYKITLSPGRYSYNTQYTFYSSFTINEVILNSGDVREIKINIGESYYLRTKTVRGDPPAGTENK